MKILTLLFFYISTAIFSQDFATVSDYNFPMKDPFVATIVGSSTLMKENVSEDMDITEFKIKLRDREEIPESLWYEEGFRFSLVKQSKKAPLVFVIAGTGAKYNSTRMTYFQRIFSDAGYNVISISSPINMNFLLNASKDRMPGMLQNDSEDIYRVMELALEKARKKVEITDIYMVGYSLGATQAAFVSHMDEKEKKIGFKRVFLMNPAVDMYKSGLKLDNLLDSNAGGDKNYISKLLDEVFKEISKQSKGTDIQLSESNIYKLFTNKIISDEKMRALIGLGFRLTSVDLNYVADVTNNRKVYVDEPVKKYDSLFKYYEKINFANFQDYLYNVAIPYYEERGVSKEIFLSGVKLNVIETYLKNNDKIAVVTNSDDLILDSQDLRYLKDIFQDRIIIFPAGGHSGNMYYGPNVETMLNYLKSGVLKYEN